MKSTCLLTEKWYLIVIWQLSFDEMVYGVHCSDFVYCFSSLFLSFRSRATNNIYHQRITQNSVNCDFNTNKVFAHSNAEIAWHIVYWYVSNASLPTHFASVKNVENNALYDIRLLTSTKNWGFRELVFYGREKCSVWIILRFWFIWHAAVKKRIRYLSTLLIYSTIECPMPPISQN